MSRYFCEDCPDVAFCDFCGKEMDPYATLKSFWKDKTRDFCGIACLEGFKVASSVVNEDEVFEGPPGTAKRLLESLTK